MLNEHQESEDEERYNFVVNTHFHIKQAFSNVKPEKNKWVQKHLEFLLKKKIFEKLTDFNKYVSLKEFRNKGFFKYSLNPTEDFGQTVSLESSFFPKFLIMINLLFEISYLYQYQFDIGYRVILYILT